MRSLLLGLISLSTLLLIGCGSGGSGTDDAHPRTEAGSSLSGLWLTTYLLMTEDQCGLLPEGEEGFLDEQEVLIEGDSATLFSAFLPTPVYEGSVRASDSFFANATIEGDLFADGSFCQLIEDVAFNNANEATAETLYHVQIVCSDGFQCDTAVRGIAERVSSFDVPEEESVRHRALLVKP